MKTRSLLFAAICSAMAACRPDTKIDVIPPQVNSVEINGFDSSAFSVMAGDTLYVAIGLSDNDALNEMRLVIHDADNGHVHNGTGHTGGEFHLNSGIWGKEEVIEFASRSAVQNEVVQVIVPDTIAGNWHLVVTAMDQVGQVSKEHTVLLKVENPDLPFITVTTWPLINNEGIVYMQADSNLTVGGTVSDMHGVDKILVYSMNALGTMSEVDTIDNEVNSLELEFAGATFDMVPAGTFRVVVEAIDAIGSRRVWDAKVIAQ
ncbi:MAG: DUF4625 domain-containing protein [Flavobacteriales bacterium]|jgi:hypothetical protein